ncbi:hypothetical protein M9H77_17346 [Catharanthus roseus]|uniref:Uncharacterized protein n=1 Tax=Catharanthus roseus TaxID=4058 RepID=A0ACC0B4Q5_CATRO|nr:hypothetical protein M9H77_17346 [Catharanthus roseus]
MYQDDSPRSAVRITQIGLQVHSILFKTVQQEAIIKKSWKKSPQISELVQFLVLSSPAPKHEYSDVHQNFPFLKNFALHAGRKLQCSAADSCWDFVYSSPDLEQVYHSDSVHLFLH